MLDYPMDLLPIAGISIETHDHQMVTLNPQDDMTPVESLRIGVMFMVIMDDRSPHPRDVLGYIREHGLERHFDIVQRDIEDELPEQTPESTS